MKITKFSRRSARGFLLEGQQNGGRRTTLTWIGSTVVRMIESMGVTHEQRLTPLIIFAVGFMHVIA